MDYTPGGFDNATQDDFVPRSKGPMVMGTRAHATALYVVFESELQMLADSPDAYEGQKEMQFLQAVPASWDETRVLNGVPPKYITVARRRGSDWFLGAITDWDAREIDTPLSFLGGGTYRAEIYSDGPDAATHAKDSRFESRQVTAATVLKLKLAPGGGCAIRFTLSQ
jgi:alpha-glucosidase